MSAEAKSTMTGADVVILEAVSALDRLASLAPEVDRVVNILADSFSGGHRVYACGNGGSAADAQHLVGELLGRFAFDRLPLPAVALTSDTATITAIANDYGFEYVFARQVTALAKPGDVLVAISTSGSSPSVLRAADAARAAGAKVVGLTGSRGNALAALCDECLVVPSDVTARIQEGHSILIHALCQLVEEGLFGNVDGEGSA